MISQRQLLKSSIIVGAACLSWGLCSGATQAIDITVNFDSTTLTPDFQTTYTTTQGGITATLENYNSPGSTLPPVAAGEFLTNANGILLEPPVAASESDLGDSFTLSFNVSVLLKSFIIGADSSTNTNLTLNLLTPGPDSIGNDFFLATGGVERTVDFANDGPILLPAGQVATIQTINAGGGKNAQTFGGVIVEAVTWETDVLPLVGATILFGGGMWWKRRRAASQIDLTATPDHTDHPTS